MWCTQYTIFPSLKDVRMPFKGCTSIFTVPLTFKTMRALNGVAHWGGFWWRWRMFQATSSCTTRAINEFWSLACTTPILPASLPRQMRVRDSTELQGSVKVHQLPIATHLPFISARKPTDWFIPALPGNQILLPDNILGRICCIFHKQEAIVRDAAFVAESRAGCCLSSRQRKSIRTPFKPNLL